MKNKFISIVRWLTRSHQERKFDRMSKSISKFFIDYKIDKEFKKTTAPQLTAMAVNYLYLDDDEANEIINHVNEEYKFGKLYKDSLKSQN